MILRKYQSTIANLTWQGANACRVNIEYQEIDCVGKPAKVIDRMTKTADFYPSEITSATRIPVSKAELHEKQMYLYVAAQGYWPGVTTLIHTDHCVRGWEHSTLEEPPTRI